MSNYIIDMFSIPFSHIEVINWEEKKKTLLDMMNDLEFSLFDMVKTSYNEDPSNNFKLNEKLYNIFGEELQVFSDQFEFDKKDFLITGSWFQIEEKGMFHRIHNHGHHGFSCVCYIEYDSECHTPTNFIAPYYDFLSGETVYFSPPNIKEGSLIIFPSFINHYTIPNPVEKLRKILSFNIKIL